MSKEIPMTRQRDDRTEDPPVGAEGARRATGAATGGAASGPSTVDYLLLAALQRICEPGPKTDVAAWHGKTILPSLWHLPAERFTSQAFWDCFEQIHLGPLHTDAVDRHDEFDRAQGQALGLWKTKRLVGPRVLSHDATSLSTFVASTDNRNTIARRGHSKQGHHNLRQVGMSSMLDGTHGLSLCHHVYPGNLTDSEEFSTSLPRTNSHTLRGSFDRWEWKESRRCSASRWSHGDSRADRGRAAGCRRVEVRAQPQRLRLRDACHALANAKRRIPEGSARVTRLCPWTYTAKATAMVAPPSKRYLMWATATASATPSTPRGPCPTGAATSRGRGPESTSGSS